MYSPLNPVSSSQTHIIPDSPDRSGATRDAKLANGMSYDDRPKSESPELAFSVHEYPACNGSDGSKAKSTKPQAHEDAIASSSQQNADTTSGEQRTREKGIDPDQSVALQGHRAPSVELGPSLADEDAAARTSNKRKWKALSELRRQISDPPDPIETSQEQKTPQGQKQPQMPASPLQIAVAGRVYSPLSANVSARTTKLGGFMVPEISNGQAQDLVASDEPCDSISGGCSRSFQAFKWRL